MANTLQKIIYYFSTISPVGLAFSFVWIIQKQSYVLPSIILIISFLLLALFQISFSYGLKNLTPINVRVTDVSANDIWVLGFVITYLLPFGNFLVEEWNLVFLGVIGGLIGIFLIFMNDAIPNPLLVLRGYHFYKITTENGVSSYVLICKKKLRNKKEVKIVNRLFEFLLIER